MLSLLAVGAVIALAGVTAYHAMGSSSSFVDLSAYNDDRTLEFPNSFYFTSAHANVDDYLNNIREYRTGMYSYINNYIPDMDADDGSLDVVDNINTLIESVGLGTERPVDVLVYDMMKTGKVQ